jgi:hypothetical protein
MWRKSGVLLDLRTVPILAILRVDCKCGNNVSCGIETIASVASMPHFGQIVNKKKPPVRKVAFGQDSMSVSSFVASFLPGYRNLANDCDN